MATARKYSRTQEERNNIAKTRLCQAALELFALQGYDCTTLSDIGVRAGYSRSLAQYHFSSKTQLAEMLLEEMGQKALKTDVLQMPPMATGEEAWQKLEKHLAQTWSNYGSMLDGHDTDLAARGEMILNVTAIFSPDPVLREKLREVSDVLIQRIQHALRLCIRDGVIRHDVDPYSVATFYSASIWGIANALFAAPQERDRLVKVVETLKGFMNTLRQQSAATPGCSHENREL